MARTREGVVGSMRLRLLMLVLLAAGATRAAEPVAPRRSVLFPLSAVRVQGGPFLEHQELTRRYLLRLDPDRLLAWYRREAGLDPKAPPYRGWESEGATPLAGHILAFYLSSGAMMYQATGDPELLRRLEYVVDELAAVQARNGNGYALATPGGRQLFRDVAAGRIDAAGGMLNGAFEPTYALNKLMLGLMRVWEATGYEPAREVLIGLADWFGGEVLDPLSDEQVQRLLECEHGSLNESFADVYALTGDVRYLEWARRLCHRRLLEPFAARRDILTGFHANTQIPKFTGFERIHSFTRDPELATAARFFWESVTRNRSWAIGGNSVNEHFFDPAQSGEAVQALAGPESCNSVNMLRLTEALYQADDSVAMVDYYERTLYNHVLSTQDPRLGGFVYYTSMLPGHYRSYSDETGSMWCCVGTGMESPAKYGQMIYAHGPDDDSLTVNLFLPSELNWRERGVRLRQETRFPDEPTTTLRLACRRPSPFTLRIRHPGWVPAGAMRIAVNGQVQGSVSAPGRYACITRTWHNGDVLRVSFPMAVTVEWLGHGSRYAALLYGPIVLTGRLGAEGLTSEDFWAIGDPCARKTLDEDRVPVLVGDAEALPAGVRRVDPRRLLFRTEGLAQPADVELAPLWENHYQRYAVYWQVFRPAEWAVEGARRAEARRASGRLDAATVDRVVIGDPASESAHRLQGAATNTGSGAYGHRMTSRWRDAANGWFSYELALEQGVPLDLACTYWGREIGARTFDITVDGRVLATVSLDGNHPEDFYTVRYRLPAEMVEGRERVTVRFQAHPGNMAGGVFDVRVLRAGE